MTQISKMLQIKISNRTKCSNTLGRQTGRQNTTVHLINFNNNLSKYVLGRRKSGLLYRVILRQ